MISLAYELFMSEHYPVTLNKKSTGMETPFLIIFVLSRMSRASDSPKDALKKQILRIHPVFSHVCP